MGQCRDCHWWREATRQPSGAHVGRCERAYKPKLKWDTGVERLEHPLPNGAKMYTTQPANIWVYDDFGCILFEAKA